MGGFFRQYAWVIDLVGILFCSFLLAKIAGVYLGKALEVKRSVSAVKAAEAEPAERRQVDISEYAVIVDRNTGEVFVGKVPPYSVVVPGSLPGKPLPDGSPGPSLSCAVIVKRVDAQTRAKTGINELLRD